MRRIVLEVAAVAAIVACALYASFAEGTPTEPIAPHVILYAVH